MKRVIFVKLGMLLVCLLLVGMIPQMAKAQEDTTIVTDTLYSSPEIDGDIGYSEYYSRLFVGTISDAYPAGDCWDLISGGENYVRSYLSFDLSSLPDSITVIEATLNIYQSHSGGNDTLGRFPIDTDHDDRSDCLDFYSSRTKPFPYLTVRYKKRSGVGEWGDYSLPGEFRLEQNFPNPFNENTVIRYSLLVDRSAISLKIYNILGKEVRRLVSEEQRAGRYEVVWDGRDDTGEELVSGVYFYKLECGGFIATRRLVLLR